MTPEVKKRIEQIRQGIVPEGYKKGKIGIVPIKWNEVPFSTLFTSTSEYTDDLKQYPLYSLTIEDGITAKIERYERSHLVKKENSYKVVRPNDYAYNPMNIRFGAVARHKGDIPVAVSGYYDIFTTVHESDLVFMDSFLTYGPMITYYNKVSTGSLVEKQRVHFSDFLEFSLALPPLEERKKIAEILSTQDKAIELQGRKIEELKRFKKGCLEKMFPRKGQKVPEKRFPGFTDDWEQRKAIDIADYSKGNGYSKGDLTDAGTPIILYGRLYTKYQFAISEVDTFAFPRNGAVYSQGNEVIVPASGETAEDIARASAVEKSGVLLGGDLNILRPFDFINPLFLALAISNGEPQKELAKKAQGKSVVHIHNTDIQEVTIAYPSRTEQDRIVSVFRQLDNLITLHQRKGKAAVSGCSNDANNSKGVCCKARDFGYKCHKKDEPNRFDA